MAPILLDNRGLLKLGSIFILTLVIVFGAGFLSGFQQAGSIYHAGNETAALTLPEPETVSTEHLQQQLPDNTSAGADIDVDRPELETLLVSAASADIATHRAASEAASEAASVEGSTLNTKTEIIAEKKTVDEVTREQVASAQPEPGASTTTAVATNSTPTISKASSPATKIRYTIQIGMYGRLLNAENLVAMLKAQKVDAYVSEFVNSKNEVRYNVRFGYFSDKKSALTALKDYKDTQKGEGYLVNFSRKDLTNLADADEAKPVVEENLKDKLSAPKSETQNAPVLEKTTTSAVSPAISDVISDEALIVVTQ